jgi:hypothetical protein
MKSCALGSRAALWAGLIFALASREARGASLPKYYAHEANLDEFGVIAPWYHGLNGQCDLRVRIAAETLKRYPWTTTNEAVASYPHYVFSGVWQVSSNGTITPKTPEGTANGDLGQRAVNLLNAWVDYYAYSGDPAAIAHLTYMADFVVNHSVTAADQPWPGMFVSVPAKGKAYGNADPHGWIQLDLCAAAGRALVRAYEMTGNVSWFDAAKHWADLLASRCNLDPTADPWLRYANHEDTPWKDDRQTGGVTMILAFLDQLIEMGYSGDSGIVVKARDAGRHYLRERLLPLWTANEAWGRYFWDWANPVQNCVTTPDAARYLIDNPEVFPNWRTDARNILTLFLNRSSVSPLSGGDVYNGAWAYPEACNCCLRSLWYSPIILAPELAHWGVAADSVWARELAYRQIVLQTYDIHESGVTEDNIDGGTLVNDDWFNIAHPLPFRFLLEAIGWLPEELGASRENHLVRSSSVVNSITYGKGRIHYSTFDAPAPAVDTHRLAFAPKTITADGRALPLRRDLSRNGYTVKALPNGDAVVAIRHDGTRNIQITGQDPQTCQDDDGLSYAGAWKTQADESAYGHSLHLADSAGAETIAKFRGNQVRLIGRVDPTGGIADVYLDGAAQLVSIDCWNPTPRNQQVLYYKNGLTPGEHMLRIVTRGARNPYSSGNRIYVDAVQSSEASAPFNFPSGGGPTNTQRMIFGYTKREDYRDSNGNFWRPATEVVTRTGADSDSVAAAWWTERARRPSRGVTAQGDTEIAGTPDPELYRYGVHWPEFWVNVTVGPGEYHVRLKFAAARGADTQSNIFNVAINGEIVAQNFSVVGAAGGPNRTADLVFDDIAPRDGIIEVRCQGACGCHAFAQALEVGPGPGGKGAEPP